MGVSLSLLRGTIQCGKCAVVDETGIEINQTEKVVVKSGFFEGGKEMRSVKMDSRDSETAIMKSFRSGRMVFEGSVNFRQAESDPYRLETTISIEHRSRPVVVDEGKTKGSVDCKNMGGVMESTSGSTVEEKVKVVGAVEEKMKVMVDHPSLRLEKLHLQKREFQNVKDGSYMMDSPKHAEAAVKLQKVYKSFRTRRNLADCAVVVNQLWWNALDFAALKRSSVSFFDIDKPETAVSRWSRARTRAAKVGKGLSKDEKARKLALQHWLEAIDPRHRYGHNLHFYYDEWLDCDSKQPFFYWLDVGEGKEVNLDKCPRLKLQQQCIKYLGPKEREEYEVVIKNGMLMYRKTGMLLDTFGGSETKWIFVLSTTKKLYVAQKKKGTFQHSSFLAGGATSAAGRLVVHNGNLEAIWPYSGHYRPTEENFEEFISFLQEHGVDLSNVKKSPSEDDDQINREGSKRGLRSRSSRFNLEVPVDLQTSEESTSNRTEPQEDIVSENTNNGSSTLQPEPLLRRLQSFRRAADAVAGLAGIDSQSSDDESPSESSTSGEYPHFCKRNLFDSDDGQEAVQVHDQSILSTINTRRDGDSYHLGRQLSCKWTTGVGPRIGFVRDHPSELQCRALEHVNLSPRSGANCKSGWSPRPGMSGPLSSPKISRVNL